MDEGAPAPPSQSPPCESASSSPHLQRQETPAVKHLLRSKQKAMLLFKSARERKKLREEKARYWSYLEGRCHSQIVLLLQWNKQNHRHPCTPGKAESFSVAQLRSRCLGTFEVALPPLFWSPTKGHPQPELLCHLLKTDH